MGEDRVLRPFLHYVHIREKTSVLFQKSRFGLGGWGGGGGSWGKQLKKLLLSSHNWKMLFTFSVFWWLINDCFYIALFSAQFCRRTIVPVFAGELRRMKLSGRQLVCSSFAGEPKQVKLSEGVGVSSPVLPKQKGWNSQRESMFLFLFCRLIHCGGAVTQGLPCHQYHC